MFSKSRAFFLSSAVVIFLTTGFFWLSLLLGFTSLENFVVNLTQTKLFGYYIPEIFGSVKSDLLSSQALRLKILCTLSSLLFCGILIYISFLDGFSKMIKAFSKMTGWILLAIVCYIFFVIENDDHIMNDSDKLELFLFTAFSIVTGPLLISYSNKKPRVKKPIKQTLPKAKTPEIVPKEEGDGETGTESTDESPEKSDNETTDDKSADDSAGLNDGSENSLQGGAQPSTEDSAKITEESESNTEKPEADSSNLSKTEDTLSIKESEDSLSLDGVANENLGETLPADEAEEPVDIEFNEKQSADELIDEGPSDGLLPPPTEDLPEELLKLRNEAQDSEGDEDSTETENKFEEKSE